MKKNGPGVVSPESDYGPRPAVHHRSPASLLSAPRAAVFDLLVAQPEPCTVAALARLIHQHPNTVREHLDGLVESGLVERTRSRSTGRGRPAWLYAALEGEDNPGAREYAGLASALAAQLARTSDDPAGDAVEAGRTWGRELARAHEPARNPTEARREVVAVLDELGFSPDPDPRAMVVKLRRCPLLEAAYRHPDIVCGVHLGIVQGVLEQIGGPPEGTALLPFAEPGACRLELTDRSGRSRR